MKIKRSFQNIFWGLFSQIIILLLGLVLPRLFLIHYGSEINGIIASVNQVFTYVALLESGIGAATVQALYKPIIEDNKEDICSILSATKYYYKKVSLLYLIAIILISIIYPFLVTTTLNWWQLTLIILFQGLPGVVNFYFQATLLQLLLAEGKNYIVSNVNLIIQISIYISKIILVLLKVNIIYIQAIYFLISLVQMLIYFIYFRRKYKWVNLNKKPNHNALNQKNSFLIHQISLLIFSSTDMIILSIFCDFEVVSIYSIYNLIFTSINMLIGTIYNSISFNLGHNYHACKKNYIKIHDTFENYYISFVFATISICYILIIPFLRLYTQGISDGNYINQPLGLLFCLVQLLTSIRVICNNLIRISGHMKNTISRTIIESGINLVASMFFVNKYGIYGVLMGTIVALLYRTIDIVLYANYKILKRKPHKLYKITIVNMLLFLIVIYISQDLKLDFVNYLDFINYSIIISIVIYPIFLTITSINCRDEWNFIMKYVYSIFPKKF